MLKYLIELQISDRYQLKNSDLSQGPTWPEARILDTGQSQARPEARKLNLDKARPGPISKKVGPSSLY